MVHIIALPSTKYYLQMYPFTDTFFIWTTCTSRSDFFGPLSKPWVADIRDSGCLKEVKNNTRTHIGTLITGLLIWGGHLIDSTTFLISALNELVCPSFWILCPHHSEHSCKGQKVLTSQGFIYYKTLFVHGELELAHWNNPHLVFWQCKLHVVLSGLLYLRQLFKFCFNSV